MGRSLFVCEIIELSTSFRRNANELLTFEKKLFQWFFTRWHFTRFLNFFRCFNMKRTWNWNSYFPETDISFHSLFQPSRYFSVEQCGKKSLYFDMLKDKEQFFLANSNDFCDKLKRWRIEKLCSKVIRKFTANSCRMTACSFREKWVSLRYRFSESAWIAVIKWIYVKLD